MQKNRCIRVGDIDWASWKAEAAKLNLSVVELIRAKMSPELITRNCNHPPHMQAEVAAANAQMRKLPKAHKWDIHLAAKYCTVCRQRFGECSEKPCPGKKVGEYGP